MSGSGNESVFVALMSGTRGDAGSGFTDGRFAMGLDAFGAAAAKGARGLRTIREVIKHATKVLVHEWWSANVVLVI